MEVYTPLQATDSLQQDHLSRRLAAPTTRLRTLAASQDSRLAIATQSNISVLHPQKALSHLYRPLQHTVTLDRTFRITQSIRAPAVGHELIYSRPVESGRRDTVLATGDIVSLSWCTYGLVFVCGRGGVYRIPAGGKWGCVLGPLEPTFLPVREATLADTGFMSDVLCVTCVALREEELMILGRKSCVEIYALQQGQPSWRMRVREGYVLTVDAMETVTNDAEEKVLLAAGGDGVVTIHELSDSGCHETLVWKMEEVPRLQQVSNVSFIRGTLRAEICLAIAASNGFVVVDLRDGEVAGVHAVEEAHHKVQFVSGCVVCADGSVVTGGLDGSVLRWRLEASVVGSTAHCDVIQTAGNRDELVKSVVGTSNGFGVLVSTSSRRPNQEVRDVEDATLPKFAATARTTMVSLYVLPLVDVNLVESTIVCMLKNLETSVYYDKAICLWDIELFLSEYDCDKSGLLERLMERFFDMVNVHQERDGETRAYYQRAKVMLWLARSLLRVSGDNDRAKEVSTTRTELRNSLLCAYYDQCLSKFLAKADVENTSDLERKALECMCQFVSVCKVRFNLHTRGMKSRVVEVRELLMPFIAAGESTATPCPICAGGMPLVADAHEPATFYCGAGDVFSRCVKTGLPLDDVLPLRCASCDARASTSGAFEWIVTENCPLCSAQMQESSGEPF